MAEVLQCTDIFTGCTHVVRGQTREEVLGQVAEHACNTHGVCEITPALKAQVEEAIHRE